MSLVSAMKESYSTKEVIIPNWMKTYFRTHDGYAYSEKGWDKIEAFMYKHQIIFCLEILEEGAETFLALCSYDPITCK